MRSGQHRQVQLREVGCRGVGDLRSGRGPRVAQRWLGSEGRHAPPPQMGEAKGSEAVGGEPKGGESEGGEGEAESSSDESACSRYSTEADTE